MLQKFKSIFSIQLDEFKYPANINLTYNNNFIEKVKNFNLSYQQCKIYLFKY